MRDEKGRDVPISSDMARKTKETMLYARVEPSTHKRIKSMIADAGSTQTQFVYDAVMEKMERAGIGTTEIGPLRGLVPEDRERVEGIADLLRAFTDEQCPLLRVAVDTQNQLLLEIVRAC